MSGSRIGARKRLAKSWGLALDELAVLESRGLKRCTRCKAWRALVDFGRDRSRPDGVDATCGDCRVQAIGRPGKRLHRQMAKQGKRWCVDCRAWLAAAEVDKTRRCQAHRRANGRLYYAKNAEAISARVQARKRKLDYTPIWWKNDTFLETDGLCAYGCGRQAITLDHVLPVCRGGRSVSSNLVPVCTECNSAKGGRDHEPWIQRLAKAYPSVLERLIGLGEWHPGGPF